jgi:hypothetical protein
MEDKQIAYLTLFAGIGLIAFTFISALVFLINNPTITGTSDIVEAFGSSLAPLIEASIRIMYLGVMGWIGLGLTTRGMHFLTALKKIAKIPNQPAQNQSLNTEEMDNIKEFLATEEPAKTKSKTKPAKKK